MPAFLTSQARHRPQPDAAVSVRAAAQVWVVSQIMPPAVLNSRPSAAVQRGSHVTQTSAYPAVLPHWSLSSSRSWPSPSQDPEASTLASSRESPDAYETQSGPPQECTAREAIEAAARSPSNPDPDDRRSWGRS